MYYSIYRVTNTTNNKQYIGFSCRPYSRWYDHKKSAEKQVKGCLYDAFRKYGVDNFIFEVIYQSKDKNHTQMHMEQYFINEHNSVVPNGYNVAPGGIGGSIRNGMKHTSETKIKISKSHLGKKQSKETCFKKSTAARGNKNHMFGKKHSVETISKIRKKALNRVYDPMCRNYISGEDNPTAKQYTLKTPNNETLVIKNLKHFCINNNLHEGELRKTLKSFKTHKGYRLLSKIK